MSDKAAGQKARSPEGCDENGPAAALLLSHVSIQICSFVAPCRRPILIATPLHQSLTWCTRLDMLGIMNSTALRNWTCDSIRFRASDYTAGAWKMRNRQTLDK